MIGAIIQARMGSTRLPGKIFMPLMGQPLLHHVVHRLKPSRYLNKIIVATTVAAQDQQVEDWCKKNNILYFRGSENDVLDRYYQCAQQFQLDVVVRITADDPFKDYQLMDTVIQTLISDPQLDFTFNNSPATYPEGLDVEAFRFTALQKAAQTAQDPFEREHITQYFFRNPSQFKMKNVSQAQNLSSLRWTIDREEDFKMASEVYNHLYKTEKPFLTDEILNFLKMHPEVVEINKAVTRSHMYTNN